MHVGQAEVAALESVSQSGVLDAEQVQNRGMQIVDVNLVFDRVESEFIGLAVNDGGLDAAAAEPDGVAVRMIDRARSGRVRACVASS